MPFEIPQRTLGHHRQHKLIHQSTTTTATTTITTTATTPFQQGQSNAHSLQTRHRHSFAHSKQCQLVNDDQNRCCKHISHPYHRHESDEHYSLSHDPIAQQWHSSRRATAPPRLVYHRQIVCRRWLVIASTPPTLTNSHAYTSAQLRHHRHQTTQHGKQQKLPVSQFHLCFVQLDADRR